MIRKKKKARATEKAFSKNLDIFEYAVAETDAVLLSLKSSKLGLSENEARRRLGKEGANVLSGKKKAHLMKRILKLFSSPLILILSAAAIISLFFNGTTNAIIIAVMILLSVALDFFEENRAEKTVNSIIDSVKVKIMVLRSGEKKEIAAEEVCCGDVLDLVAGDVIPADCRLIASKDFFINQSALTGESFPAEKNDAKCSAEIKSVTDATNLIFAGTYVVSGYAQAVVVATGVKTEYGKIAVELNAEESHSEFETGIRKFGVLIVKITLLLVLFIFVVNLLLHGKFLESFLFSIAIAVGVTPELLPMIMSVTMSRGSMKMAQKGVIVKRLVAIPNLGSMDVLCTDKTGTLTEDKIVLVKHIDIAGNESENVWLSAYFNSYYQSGAKNPLDTAILDHQKVNLKNIKKISEIPFDFLRKRVSVAISQNKTDRFITKGAPEEIFKICSTYDAAGASRAFDANALSVAKKYYEELSRDGFRVLAVAEKTIADGNRNFTKNDERNLQLKGFVAFFDPPKADAFETLKEMRRIGVQVKVLTGDNELVTKKICHEIGLPVTGIMLGKSIHSLSDAELKKKVEKTTIFARFTPEEKNRVIRMLRLNGHVVGYLGDGINDAPSLKTADVGISVNNAVSAAKETADIVLKYKNLQVLKDGIIEGRRAFGNTMKYIMMGLSSNFGNMFSAAGAILFLPFLPMLPIQILLNNFLYDFSQVTIPLDNVDSEWIDKPKRWDINYIKRFMYVTGPVSSLFDIATFLIFFYVLKTPESVFQTVWFLESIATQTLVIHFVRTRKTPFFQSSASKWLVASTFGVVAIAWIFPYTPLAAFFHMVPLSLNMLLIIAVIVVLDLLVLEAAKRVFYKKFAY